MKQNKKPILIGITGGIASGKTLVAKQLIKMGAKVLNADKITHSLYLTDGEGAKVIAQVFGDAYINNKGVDRKKLGALVFKNKEELSKLNMLIHPLIMQKLFSKVHQDDGVVFFEAAILVESKMMEHMDEIWLVVCELSARIERLKRRDDIDDAQVGTILNSQMGDEAKRAYADYIIDNTGSQENTYAQVKNLLDGLMIRLKKR